MVTAGNCPWWLIIRDAVDFSKCATADSGIWFLAVPVLSPVLAMIALPPAVPVTFPLVLVQPLLTPAVELLAVT
jgi:hypothetical protein